MATETRFQCPQCPRAFKRPEHLKRHANVHSRRNLLACSICSKTFTRSDVRNRHESLHGLQPTSNPTRTRACLECARVRGRCNKADPSCSRCVSRALACVYPHRGGDDKPAHDPDPEPSPRTTTTPPATVPQPLAEFPAVDFPDLFAQSRIPVDLDLALNSINWLEPNYSMDIDFTSILGFGAGGNAEENDPSAGSEWEMALAENPTATDQTAVFDDFSDSHTSQQPSSGLDPSAMAALPTRKSSASPTASAPSPTAVSTASRLSFASTSPRLLAHGGIYATSTVGSRIPCTARIRQTPLRIPGLTQLPPVTVDMNDGEENIPLAFPKMPLLSCPLPEKSVSLIDDCVFSCLQSHFQQLCLQKGGILFSPFAAQHFPSLDYCNLFAGLYFQHFDPILPIYHTHVASIRKSENWVLALAVMAIGSQYTETVELAQCIEPLHEFLRRALVVEIELYPNLHCPLSLVQALVLSQVGMLYQGSKRLATQAQRRRGLLIDVVSAMGLLNMEQSGSEPTENIRAPTLAWSKWLLGEARRRVGYAIWLIDCMAVYHLDWRPLLSLGSAQCELPHDNLWAAQTADEWCSRLRASDKNPSLITAVHTLFLNRQAKQDLGEFAQLLLLHGVYHTMFRVQEYYSDSLSTWIPSDGISNTNVCENDRDEASSRRANDPWRSATMDCVDVLHWAANSMVAQLAGAEHATVLHLQFSRVVLWSPYASIRAIASYAAAQIDTNSRVHEKQISFQEAMNHENKVLQWALRDEHKARLTALHCGTVFWHVRRYSCRAFYEPHAVFLTTLVLWAFSAYASRGVAGNGGEPREDAGDPSSNPKFIHLDRPCDDEMVQYFVRCGRPGVVNAHVAGVGDIYGSGAPGRILRVGQDLLTATADGVNAGSGGVSTAWGRTGEYLRILKGLEAFINRGK